jgi:MtrB/PioB family decaheme-associated outer membrane protein
MKTNIMILTLIFSLMALSDAFPQDKTIEGEVSLEGIWVDVDAKEGGKAKFTEYRDLKEDGGVYGRAKLKFDTDKQFLNFDSGDFGYDTQFYKIDGGLWGKFKLDLFYDEIPHNFAFDARSTFSGAGSDTLTGTPNANFSSWETFDYSIERRQYGGGLKVNWITPFFFDASFQREEREGIKPTGVAETSPGGIAFELPEPVKYTTNNLNVEGGYAKRPFFISFSYFLSEYNNSNTSLNLPPNFDSPRVFSLPPDNNYYKGAFKGAVNLPFHSKFSTNIGLSKGKSDTSILSLIGSDYEGRVYTRNYDFALTSNPVRFLDAKVYYKDYKRDNDSDDPLGVVDLFLDYRISTLGGELGLRLPAQLYLSGGYEYVKTKRNKEGEEDPEEILPFDKDNVYHVDLRWTGLDFLEARLGYEKLDRDADYQTVESDVNLYNRRYSYASQDRDTYKATVDIFPLESLDFSLEYRYKDIDYSDTVYGLRSDKRHEFDLSADYKIGKIAKVYGYGDFGWIKFDQSEYKRAQLPFSPPPEGKWEAKQKDRSWGYGIGSEIYVIPQKFTLIFQHDYMKSNGNVDFTIDPALFIAANGLAGANNEIVDISRWDDYTLYCFKAKAVYHFTKSLLASLGYAYERFNYKDAQLDNYQFAPLGPPNSNAAFLTGAYKDQSYKANLVFGGVTYQF